MDDSSSSREALDFSDDNDELLPFSLEALLLLLKPCRLVEWLVVSEMLLLLLYSLDTGLWSLRGETMGKRIDKRSTLE